MTTIESLNHYIEVQLQAWNRCDENESNVRKAPVIAITRQPGCDAEPLAQALAKEFGMVVHACEIIEQIARDAHVSEKVVATLDTRVRSELADWQAGFEGAANLSAGHYLECLRKVLFTIATHGNAVILGRGANFLLPPGKKTVGLSLVAPREMRANHMMRTLNLSHTDALTQLDRAEKEQQRWVRKYGKADIDDATHYHLVINTALVKNETIIQFVRTMINAGETR